MKLPTAVKVIWRTLKEKELQDCDIQSRFVLVDHNEGKSTTENPLDMKASARIVAPEFADPDILNMHRDSLTTCREAINVLLTISVNKGKKEMISFDSRRASSFHEGSMPRQRSSLVLWDTKEWSSSSRSLSWQIVTHLERPFGFQSSSHCATVMCCLGPLMARVNVLPVHLKSGPYLDGMWVACVASLLSVRADLTKEPAACLLSEHTPTDTAPVPVHFQVCLWDSVAPHSALVRL